MCVHVFYKFLFLTIGDMLSDALEGRYKRSEGKDLNEVLLETARNPLALNCEQFF